MEILWDEASTSFNDWEVGSGEEVEIGQARGYRTLLIHSVTPPSSRSRANETDCDPSPTHQERAAPENENSETGKTIINFKN